MVPAKPASSSYIPSDLQPLLSNPRTPWNVSSPLFNRLKTQAYDQPFKLCEILNSDPEFNFILKYFEHQKPAGYGIKRIVCIHNPDHTGSFEFGIKNMERESSNPAFTPKGKEEEPKAERARVSSRWESQVAQFSPIEIKSPHSREADTCSKTKVLPLWHGSSKAVCQFVCSSGFTSFGKHHYFDESASKGSTSSTDKGYFGSGIYFSNSARYAAMYSAEGQLLLAWVSMREPYPVVNDKPHPQKGTDMIKLGGKEHYQNYNAHYIPVTSIRPQDPKCLEYYPCYKDQPPAWDEIVVFHTSQTLPRFWVELGVDLPTVVIDITSNAGELLMLVLSLLDKEEIQNHAVLPGVLQAKADRLLDLHELTPLGTEDQKFLKIAKRLMPEGQKISPSTLNMLLKSVSTNPPTIDLPPSPQVPSNTPNIIPPKPVALSVASISAALPTTPFKPIIPTIAFGKEKWAMYIGDVGVEPPLPPGIEKILKSPCPFFPGKKIEETHFLTLIPKTVNGKPLNLNSLEELVKNPKKGEAIKYNNYHAKLEKEFGIIAPPSSYWAVLTKDVIPESRDKSYADQKQLLAQYRQKAQMAYEVPHLLETAVSIIMEYLQTGKRLYSDEPGVQGRTYTRCQEMICSYYPPGPPDWPSVVGGFSRRGLDVYLSRQAYNASSDDGVAALLKFIQEKTIDEKELHSSLEISPSKAVEKPTTIVNPFPDLNPPSSYPSGISPAPSKPPALFVNPLSKALPSSSPADASIRRPIQKPLPPPPVAKSKTLQPEIAFKTNPLHFSPPTAALAPVFSQTSVKSIIPAIAFGKELWEKHVGEVGAEPPLPADIDKILAAPCPFWPSKRVSETHLLVLVPQTVNGKPLTLKLLGELVQKPLQGNAIKCRNFNLGPYPDPSAPKSHWALLTRDVIEGSRDTSYSDQQALIKSYSQKTKIPYEVPTILDVVVCIFMEYVRTGNRLYSDSGPWTFTRCQEKYNAHWHLVVGGFSAAGIYFCDDRGNGENSGVGSLRKF